MSVYDTFQQLFRGRENCYGQYKVTGPSKDDKDAKTLKGQAPPEAWERHFRGGDAYGLGLAPIMVDNTCWWGAVDWDDPSVVHADLEAQIKLRNIPLIVCRSRSGGAHLYLFLTEPMPARRLVDQLNKFVKALGLINPDGRPIEIFPKQTTLTDQMPGSWINLPYFGENETQRYAIINGERATLEDFVVYAGVCRRSPAQLAVWRDSLAGPFEDGPPCLQTIHKEGWAQGGRNNGLLNVAIFFRVKHPEDWKQRTSAYNQEHVQPPLPDSEVQGLITSVENHEYVYTCEQLPIKPHCQKGLCKKQLYGISVFSRQRNLQEFPEVSQMVMVGKEDPTWLLNVAGTTVELSTDEVMQLSKFKKACFEKLQIVLPAIKPVDWDDKLKELLQNLSKIEMPDDASTEGQFRVHVLDFMSYRTRSNSKDDLLTGKPYQEGNKIYFQAKDLITYLKRRNFRAMEEHQVFKALRRMGAGHHQFNVKGACVKVWYIPEPEGEQKQALDNPVTNDQPEF